MPQVRYENGDVKAGGVTVSFGTLLSTVDMPAVEATATSPRNENRTVAYRSFGAHFCEIRVNRWTAEPRVSHWLTVIDAGQTVNAKTARSQIIGGVIMGIGNALLEDLLGARGIGEIGITGVAAAVSNAVYHATGKRIRDLPITLDKLL
jgi:xanthine dehydrogenase YagR molybdenum-binding subunit